VACRLLRPHDTLPCVLIAELCTYPIWVREGHSENYNSSSSPLTPHTTTNLSVKPSILSGNLHSYQICFYKTNKSSPPRGSGLVRFLTFPTPSLYLCGTQACGACSCISGARGAWSSRCSISQSL